MKIETDKEKKIILAIGIAVLVVAIIIISLVVWNVQKAKNDSSDTTETFALGEENIEQTENVEIIDELQDAENEIIVLEDEEPEEVEEEPKESETNKVDQTDTKNSGTPYYIKVNYGAQVVTIYKKDGDGNYTVPYKAMVCSTGTATPTSGVYKLPKKYKKAVKARWIYLQGDVWGQYGTRITGNILFHSVPYEKQDPASLEWWEYDKLGTKASLGCIRLTVIDAKWIYENCTAGTQVEFYTSSDPGPFGKPSAKKISNADESVRVWDPTDPSEDNPWKTYQEETKTEQPSNNTNQIENDENDKIINQVENTESNDVYNIVNQTNNIVKNEVVNQIFTNTIANQTNTVMTNMVNAVNKIGLNVAVNQIKQ